MNPTGVLPPGVKNVFTNRRFHLAPQKGWEATGKPAMLRVPHGISVGCQGLTALHSSAASQSHAEPLLTVHLDPLIHLLLCISRRVAHSPKHLQWPQISSVFGCSFSLGTVFIYDKYLSQTWTYLFQLTAAPTQRLWMAAGTYPNLMDKNKWFWRSMEMCSPIKCPATLAKNITSIVQAFVIPTAHSSRIRGYKKFVQESVFFTFLKWLQTLQASLSVLTGKFGFLLTLY